jgi:hypothetical protein
MKPSKLYDALHALIGERVPLHIWGECGVPEDLAGIAVYLASEESSYCVGGIFTVDAGLSNVLPATIGGMVPLQAGIPTASPAARMAAALSGSSWNTPLPIPTVDAKDSKYKSDDFRRGDVWPSTVYQTVSGLATYGHQKLAGDYADCLLDNAIKVGISEHYDSRTGAPLRVRNLGMSAVMLTMALDGISPRHRIVFKGRRKDDRTEGHLST